MQPVNNYLQIQFTHAQSGIEHKNNMTSFLFLNSLLVYSLYLIGSLYGKKYKFPRQTSENKKINLMIKVYIKLSLYCR